MHYSLNGENEAALYWQWFVIYRCPLWQVWLYVPVHQKHHLQ